MKFQVAHNNVSSSSIYVFFFKSFQYPQEDSFFLTSSASSPPGVLIHLSSIQFDSQAQACCTNTQIICACVRQSHHPRPLSRITTAHRSQCIDHGHHLSHCPLSSSSSIAQTLADLTSMRGKQQRQQHQQPYHQRPSCWRQHQCKPGRCK